MGALPSDWLMAWLLGSQDSGFPFPLVYTLKTRFQDVCTLAVPKLLDSFSDPMDFSLERVEEHDATSLMPAFYREKPLHSPGSS